MPIVFDGPSIDTKSPLPPAPAPAPGESADSVQSMHLSYERVVERLRERPIQKLEPVNLNVPVLVTTVLGALPWIAQHRDMLARLLTFDITHVDELELYTYALAHAHSMKRAAPDSPIAVAELAAEQKATREQLLIDARALASRELLDPERVGKLDNGPSHLAIAFDVVGLVGLFLESWSVVEHKTGVTRNELERARLDANRLVAALGRRQQLDPSRDPEEQIYRQIYTWVARAYSDVRKALSFLRRQEKDAHRIAPSPYPGRNKLPRKNSERAGPPAKAVSGPESTLGTFLSHSSGLTPTAADAPSPTLGLARVDESAV